MKIATVHVWSLDYLIRKLSNLLLRVWYVGWRVVLRLILRKKPRNKLLESYKQIYNVIRLTFLVYRVRYFAVRFINGLTQTKLPDGILIQPQDNITINEEIYSSGVYDRVCEMHSGDVIIDVGAHVGAFTLKAARKAKKGLIVAVEPHPFNYKLLVENIKRNRLKNVVSLNVALSSFNGVTKLFISNSSGSHSTVVQVSNRYVEVPVKKLDSILEELNIEAVNMIKMDVEGAEMEVLRGAQRTLQRNSVSLAIAGYHRSTEVHELSEFLLSKRFRVAISKDGFVYAWR